MHLPDADARFEARLWLVHRPNPAASDGPRKVMPVSSSGGSGTDPSSILFALRHTLAGAYALALDYRLPAGVSVERGWGLIFVPGANGYRVLRLGPFTLKGKGRATLAKFLLPQAIFWEEDSWFHGGAEGGESVTKFRYSDGVSWSERKGELELPAGK